MISTQIANNKRLWYEIFLKPEPKLQILSATDQRLEAWSESGKQLIRDLLAQHASNTEADNTDSIQNGAVEVVGYQLWNIDRSADAVLHLILYLISHMPIIHTHILTQLLFKQIQFSLRFWTGPRLNRTLLGTFFERSPVRVCPCRPTYLSYHIIS